MSATTGAGPDVAAKVDRPAASEHDLRRAGRAWIVGDDLVLDTHVLDYEYALARITDPEALVPHLFEAVRPELAGSARPGDVVVTGEWFGKGHTHVQGFIAMRALGLGLVCRSMHFLAKRAAVAYGVPVLSDCPDVLDVVSDGDPVTVDFVSGEVVNRAGGERRSYQPLEPPLLELVRAGGLLPSLRQRLSRETGDVR